jgi:hypothetical protein
VAPPDWGIVNVRVDSSLIRQKILAGVALICTLGVVARASASTPDPAEQRLAREQVRRGLEEARADKWDDARASFERAYALWNKPSILFNLAGAQTKTGQLVEAAESYRVLLRPDADVNDGERSVAKKELTKLEPRIAHLRVVVRGGIQVDDVVSLDNRTMPHAAIAEDLPANPGPHELKLDRSGSRTPSVTIVLNEGETRAVTLVPVVVAKAPIVREAPPPSHPITSSPWFWAGVGVVVVGATVATVCLAGACTSDDPAPRTQGNLGSVTFP